MRGKDHLFYLIKSLSKSEKRYFTLDAQKSGRKDSRYLALFQAINQQEEYSEDPLKKEFGRKLGDDKARLYEAILRAMRDYQSKKSYKTRIKELLTDAKILFERRLFEQAENRLEEAKALALELHDHLAILEINLQQRQLVRRYLHKDYQEKIQQLAREKDRHLQQLEQELWLHDNYDSLSIDVLRFPQRLAEEDLEQFVESYETVLNLDPESIESFHAKLRLHQFLALFYRLKGDSSKMLEQFTSAVASWSQHDKLISENFFLYVSDFSNLLSASSRKRETFERLPELLAELKAQEAPNYQGKAFLFERIAVYELLYLLNTPNEKIDDTLNELAKGLKVFDITPSSNLSIHFNSAVLLFLNDRFEDCLRWLDDLRPVLKKNQELRRDIHESTRIIYLLAVYKLDDFERIENTQRSVQRYFAKIRKANLSDFHKLIAQTIQQLQKSLSRRHELEALNTLKQSLNQLEGPVLAGLDEISLLWVESLIQDRSITSLRQKP